MTNVLLTITPHARMFLKISTGVGCVILSQMALYCPKKRFFEKMTKPTFA